MTGTWTAALVTLALVVSALIVGVAVAGLVYGLRRAAGRRSRAVRVSARSRHQGVGERHRPIVFSVPMGSSEFLDGLAASIPVQRATPTFLRRLYLADRDRESLTYAVGTRIKTGLTYLIVTTPTDSGCVGQAGVARWSDPDGLDAATGDVALLDERLRTTIESLGGSYRLKPSAPGVG